MPGPIIQPGLQRLTPSSRSYLISHCESQPDDIILHYLQTGEIQLNELTTLNASRKASIEQRYKQWLDMPDPKEIEAWNEIVSLSENPLTINYDVLEAKIESFLKEYPRTSHRDEAYKKMRDVAAFRLESVKSMPEDNLGLMKAKLSSITDTLSKYTSYLTDSDTNNWKAETASLANRIAREELKPLFDRWDKIMEMPEADVTDMRRKEQRMSDFISENASKFSNDVYTGFKEKLKALQQRLAKRLLEEIRYNLDELFKFIRKQSRDSELFRIADDYIWDLIKEDFSEANLKRLLNNVPNSWHADEAREILRGFQGWDPICKTGDIFKVKEFLNNNPGLPEALLEAINNELDRLKRIEIQRIEENPSAYPTNRLFGLINIDVITVDELENRGLLTHESYQRALNRQVFIDRHPIDVTYVHSPELEAEDITDVYLFGVPSTGKTCVLMGLLASDLYNWSSAIAAGEYGDILSEYRENKTLPNRTESKVFFSIHGQAKDRNGKQHLINVIELAGEQFLKGIAMNKDRELSLVDMDSVAAPHFQNNHRKIFFIVIDPTVKMIECEIETERKLDDGNIVKNTIIRTVSQKSIIKKMVNILTTSANLELMKKVDALHFIATKSDVLDLAGKDVRDAVNDYNDSFRAAAELCLPQNAHINEATGFKPKLYTFSLGKFYVGGTFDYDSTDSDKLMNVITENTLAIREPNFLEKFLDNLNTKVL